MPSSKSNPIPFGLKDGRMYEPAAVKKGLACGCTCVKCGDRLVAVNNRINNYRNYFRHHHAECALGYESAVHRMAKQILFDNKKCITPSIPVNISDVVDDQGDNISLESRVVPSRKYDFANVILETDQGAFRPDVTGYTLAETLHIEIFVSHEVDREKREKVVRLMEDMIEIDLSHLSRHDPISIDTLTSLVITDLGNKRWIYSAAALQLQQKMYTELQAMLEKRNSDINNELQRRELQRKQEQEKKAAYAASYEDKLIIIKQRIDRIRAEYQGLFNELALSMLPQAITKRETTLLKDIDCTVFTSIIGVPIKYDWVFNTHRSVWQKYILDHYVRKEVVGKLDEAEVSAAIVIKFGIQDFIRKIDHLRAVTYRDEGIQILNKDEQACMPTGVVSRYFQELIIKDVIRHAPGYLYVLGKNTYPDQEQELPNYLIGFDGYQSSCFNNNVPAEHTRAERIKESMRRIYFENQGAGRICDTCFMFSAHQDGQECPFCSGIALRHIAINKTKLHILENRINQNSESVKRSCNGVLHLNNIKLLIDWEM